MEPELLTALSALAEPNRIRIVKALDEAPRAVGELASLLDLRQPQATKHLQTLQRAGLVVMHPLGQRRLYALEREPLRQLGQWFQQYDEGRPSEEVLQEYALALAAEQHTPSQALDLTFERTLPAAPAKVWRAWTSADAVRQWWSPPHFCVADCEVDARAGGSMRIVLEEGDGTRHLATGQFVDLTPRRAFTFDLAPVDAHDQPLFASRHHVTLRKHGSGTVLTMDLHVSDVRPGAVPALAGIEIGWNQTLDGLTTYLEG